MRDLVQRFRQFERRIAHKSEPFINQKTGNSSIPQRGNDGFLRLIL